MPTSILNRGSKADHMWTFRVMPLDRSFFRSPLQPSRHYRFVDRMLDKQQDSPPRSRCDIFEEGEEARMIGKAFGPVLT